MIVDEEQLIQDNRRVPKWQQVSPEELEQKRRSWHLRAKRIKMVRQKQSELMERYKKENPGINAGQFNDYVTNLFDVSGTSEAERKNLEMFRSLGTPEGRQRMMQRFTQDLLSINPRLLYSQDPEQILTYEENHPGTFKGGFSCNDIYKNHAGGYRGAENMTEEALNQIVPFVPYWQQGGAAFDLINVLASDEVYNNSLDLMNNEEANVYYEQNPSVVKDGINIGASLSQMTMHFNNGTDMDDVFDTMKNQYGIDVDTDPQALFKYIYTDQSGKQIKLNEALDKVAANEQITCTGKGQPEIEAMEKNFLHPEKYGYTTAPNSTTKITDGIQGVGCSTLTTKTMESIGNHGAFYGGLQVNENIANQLKNDPASEFLNIQQNGNGYSVKYKLPEEGMNASQEKFKIRQAVNIFSKYYAKSLFDEQGKLNYSAVENTKEIVERGTGLGTPEKFQEMCDALNIPEAEQAVLKQFALASDNNLYTLAQIHSGFGSELDGMIHYQELAQKKDLNSNEQFYLNNNRQSYQNAMQNYHKLCDIDPETEMDFPVSLQSVAGSNVNRVLSESVNRLRAGDGRTRVIVSSPIIDMRKDPREDQNDHEAEAYDQYSATGFKVNIDGKEAFLTLETAEPSAGQILSHPGSGVGIGLYDSEEQFKNARKADNTVYIPNAELLDDIKTKYVSAGNKYLLDPDGADAAIRKEAEDRTAPLVPREEMLRRLSRQKQLPVEITSLRDQLNTYNPAGQNDFALQQSLGKMRREARAYLKAHHPLVTGVPLPEQGAEREQYDLMRDLYAYSRSEMQNVQARHPGGAVPTPGKLAENVDKSMDVMGSVTAELVAKQAFETMQSDEFKKLNPKDLAAKSLAENYGVFDDPNNTPLLNTMALLANHPEKLKEQDPNGLRTEEIDFKSRLYKPIWEAAKFTSDPRAYRAAHPEMNDGDYDRALREADRATNALSSIREIEKKHPGYSIAFTDSNGQPLSAADAANALAKGTSSVVAKSGGSPELFRLSKNGRMAPHPIIDPNAKILTEKADELGYCNKLYADIKETDPRWLWSNSNEFAAMRDTLGKLSDQKRDWKPNERAQMYQRLEGAALQYIQKKEEERKDKGSLNERSTKRLDLAYSVRALAAAMKNPEGYKSHFPSAQQNQPQEEPPQEEKNNLQESKEENPQNQQEQNDLQNQQEQPQENNLQNQQNNLQQPEVPQEPQEEKDEEILIDNLTTEEKSKEDEINTSEPKKGYTFTTAKQKLESGTLTGAELATVMNNLAKISDKNQQKETPDDKVSVKLGKLMILANEKLSDYYMKHIKDFNPDHYVDNAAVDKVIRLGEEAEQRLNPNAPKQEDVEEQPQNEQNNINNINNVNNKKKGGRVPV